MYTDKKRTNRLLILIPVLVVIFVLAVCLLKPKDHTEEDMAAIRDTIMERSVQCYVVEGAYPPDLAYLEENYGLVVNQADYIVRYEIFAENLPPVVRVLQREARN